MPDSNDDDTRRPALAHIQDFIFIRELSEVYLLLDHISGRWDKSFYNDKQADRFSTARADDQRERDWLQEICEIGWPPDPNKIEQAKQAAILLRAKDRLNAAAKPANGATIAFTLLVVGEDNIEDGPWWRSWPRSRPRSALDLSPRDPGADGHLPDDAARPPTRISLARNAFPGLVLVAQKFERRITAIVYGLLAWLVLTCALSWNVAAGNVVLAQLDAVHAEQRAIDGKIAEAESKPPLDGASHILVAEPGPVLLVRYCDRARALPAMLVRTGLVLDQFHTYDEIHLCEARAANARALDIGASGLHAWLGFWQSVHLAQTEPPLSRAAGEVNEESGRILTLVLGTSVLPLCYGILGAGAAVVRDLWAKMRESLLSPREYTLALGQLALGATIGACIGLFISPSGIAHGENGLIGAWTLSGSALSFVAGFGVESVFVALESLVRRLFNMPDARKP